jgi:hypothetical protein
VSKKQTDFNFNEAKKAATHHLSIIASFMEDMNNNFPKSVPLDWAILLRKLEIKISQASSPCLNSVDIKQIDDLGKQLVQGNPDTTKQLELFYNLYVEAFSILKSNPKMGYAPQGIIDNELARIKNADELSENLVSEAKTNRSTFAFPLALLLAHVVRAETIGYAIWKQLCDVIDNFQKLGLTKYSVDDLELMCSVHNTVIKGKKREVRSDVKAIRDSIAHGNFSIHKVADTYEIEFNNSNYPFHKVYSMKEFAQFFDLYTMLYKRQLALLFIIELLPILTTHFLKKPSAS